MNMAMTAAGYNSLDVVNLIMDNLHLSQIEYDEKRQLPYATFAKLCRVHKSWLGLGRQHLFKFISEERLQMDRILKLLILLDNKPVLGQYVKHLSCGLIRAPIRRVIARPANALDGSVVGPPEEDIEEGPELPTAFNDAMFGHLLSCLPNLKSVSVNGFEYSSNPGIRIPAICTALSTNGQMDTLTKLSLHHIGGSRENMSRSNSESKAATMRHYTSLIGFKNLVQLHMLCEDSPSFYSTWEWSLRPISIPKYPLLQNWHPSSSLRQLTVCHDPCLPNLMDVLPTTLESLTVFRTSGGDCATLARALGKLSRFRQLKDLLLLSYYFVLADCMIDLFDSIASSSIERFAWSSPVSAPSFNAYFRAPPTLKVIRLRLSHKHIDEVLTHIASLHTSLRQIILEDDSESIGTPTWENYHRVRLPYICNLEKQYRSMGIWLDCKYKDKVGYLAPTAEENATIEDVDRERKAAELKEIELLESARRRREEQERRQAEDG